MSETKPATPVATTKRRTRSPSHPVLDLETALIKTEIIRQRENRHPALVATVIQHFGYAAKSSMGQMTYAALKKFGLLDDVQSGGSGRMAALSDLGFRILADPRGDNSLERKKAIQEAATKPGIIAELFAKYGSQLPSDANIKAFLLLDKGFSENSVDSFIGVYKRTISFAGLLDSDSSSSNEEEEVNQILNDPPNFDTPHPPPGMHIRQLAMPMRDGRTLVIQAPVPMSSSEFEALEATLKAWKPLLVSESEDTSEVQ